jgi:DDE family transposase
VARRPEARRSRLAAPARLGGVPHRRGHRRGRHRGRHAVSRRDPGDEDHPPAHRTATGAAATETVYAIASVGHRYADTVLRATWLRGHWQMENTLHWVRDVTFGEDHSAVRTGAGPQVMAALRNTAINVSRLAGHSNNAVAQRHYSWIPGAAVQAITAA